MRGGVKEGGLQCMGYERAVLYDRECRGGGERANSSGGRLECESNGGGYCK